MKKYKVLISGDDNFDKPYRDVIIVEAKNEKQAKEIAMGQNGVYETEIVGEEN